MLIADLVPLLRCVECGAAAVHAHGPDLACGDCGAVWTAVNGVYDLRPRTGLALPAMYDDPDYREWNRQLASVQDYFYNSNPIVSWVQNAGHRAVRTFAENRPDALTLDMACGEGGHRPYMRRPDRVVGVDIDQGSLEKYRSRFADALVIRGDCYRLPFASSVFDRVINVYNLEHLLHLDFALEEAHRVLKDDGELIASVPAEGGLAWVLGRQLTTARQFTSETLDYSRANAIDHCNCIWQIDKAVRRHFRVVRRSVFPLRIPLYHLNLVVTWSLVKSR
jgi:SAM-dependent methyltransferase